jgi:hypothetical protein
MKAIAAFAFFMIALPCFLTRGHTLTTGTNPGTPAR